MAKVRIVQPISNGNKFDMSQPDIKVNRTLKPVDREHSNMEIEKSEYVVTNTADTGLPETYIAGGKRHSEGGTPVNLPADSFIFSRDNKMKIRDEDILKMFGKTGNKAMTPADLAKQYDINKYRQILADSNSDKLQVETAELMIANYNEKLGKLALVQESLKGFPDSIPKIAMPYLEASKFDPANITDPTGDTMPGNMDQAKYGAQVPIPEMYPALYQMGGMANADVDYIFLDGGQSYFSELDKKLAEKKQQELAVGLKNENTAIWANKRKAYNNDTKSLIKAIENDKTLLEIGLGLQQPQPKSALETKGIRSNTFVNKSSDELTKIKQRLENNYRKLNTIEKDFRKGSEQDIQKMVLPQYASVSNPFSGGNYAPLMTNVRTQQTSALPEQTLSASRRDNLVNEIMDPKNTQPAPKLNPATGGKKLKSSNRNNSNSSPVQVVDVQGANW